MAVHRFLSKQKHALFSEMVNLLPVIPYSDNIKQNVRAAIMNKQFLYIHDTEPRVPQEDLATIRRNRTSFSGRAIQAKGRGWAEIEWARPKSETP